MVDDDDTKGYQTWIKEYQGKFTGNNIHFNNLVSRKLPYPLIYINGVAYVYQFSGEHEFQTWNLGMGNEIIDFDPDEYIIARKDNDDLVCYRGHPINDYTEYEVDYEIKLPCKKEEFRFSVTGVDVFYVRNNTLYYTQVQYAYQNCSTPEELYYRPDQSSNNVVKITDMFVGFNNKIYFETEEGKVYRWHHHDRESIPGKHLIVGTHEVPNVDKYIAPMERDYSLVTIPNDRIRFYAYMPDIEGDDWYDAGVKFQFPTGYDYDDIVEMYNENTEDLIIKLNNGKYYIICIRDMNIYGELVINIEEIPELKALDDAGEILNMFGAYHGNGNAPTLLYVVMDDQNVYAIDHYENE